jgi:hypothetical protein
MNLKEIYNEMLQQGTMQNFGQLLSNFEKHTNDMLIYLMNFLLDFSYFINFNGSRTKKKQSDRSKQVVNAFIESNMVTRIFVLIKNITAKLEFFINRHKNGSSLMPFANVMSLKQYQEYT